MERTTGTKVNTIVLVSKLAHVTVMIVDCYIYYPFFPVFDQNCIRMIQKHYESYFEKTFCTTVLKVL